MTEPEHQATRETEPEGSARPRRSRRLRRMEGPATIAVGLAIGAGLAFAALAMTGATDASAPSAGGGLASVVPAFVPPRDGRATSAEPSLAQHPAALALERAFAQGPGRGFWVIQETHGSRTRGFAADPSHADRLLCRFGDATADSAPVLSFSRDLVARKVFGDAPLALFFQAYRPEAPTVENGHASYRWRSTGGGAVRIVLVERSSGDVVGLEDRAADGLVIHSARRVTDVLGEWTPDAKRHAGTSAQPAGAPGAPGAVGARPPSSWLRALSFEEVVKRSRLPVFEPARLPANFRRTDAVYVPARGPFADLVVLRYSDGLARIDVQIARPADMDRLNAMFRGRDMATCESSPAGTPEEMLEGADTLIRRREDRCRTVLRVDGLCGVSVQLFGRNELSREAYVDTIRSLARVPGSKERPVEPEADGDEPETQPTSGK